MDTNYLEDFAMGMYYQRTFDRSFGTFPLSGETLHKAIAAAVDVGYRSFDTAQMYGNEKDTGDALKSSNLVRQDLCITTKVHPNNFRDENTFLSSVETSLELLGLHYVDVLLLHWPPADSNIVPSLQFLESAYELGMTKNIGVSNYNCVMMHQAKKAIKTPLITNQVEFHPLLDQRKLLSCSAATGIPLSSYCSVARGEVFKYPEFAAIGKNHGKTAAQVALRWILQKGVSINTMSTKKENIEQNFNIMDFTISNVEMAQIDAKTATGYRIVTKNIVPWAPQWD